MNPDCISSLFWFLSSALCLSFLHVSVSVIFPFLHYSCLSFISCSPLKSFTCIIFRFMSCLRLSPSLCKTFIFLANSSVHSLYLASYLYILFLSFYPFPLVSVSISHIVCQYLVTVYHLLHAEPLHVGLPLPSFASHWCRPHCLRSLGQRNENSMYHAL